MIGRKSDLAYWADTSLRVEKIRVSVMVGISHLAKRKQKSPEREKLLELVLGVEKFVDGYMAEIVTSHPTWPWASRQKGIGKENFPKVIGLIEKFAKYYDPGDPWIPSYVKREPETYYTYNPEKEATIEKSGVFVSGIERLTTPSKLLKYAGYHVVDGHAAKRASGRLSEFNSELRTTCYRLGISLIKQVRGKEVGVWRQRYDKAVAEITSRCEGNGVKIVPTPLGRYCFNCEQEVVKKKTFYCPDCGEKLSTKEEPQGYLFEGHRYAMALREMIKDWLTCLWLVWREAEGLPLTQPYKVVKKGHEPIDPWKMVDKPC